MKAFICLCIFYIICLLELKVDSKKIISNTKLLRNRHDHNNEKDEKDVIVTAIIEKTLRNETKPIVIHKSIFTKVDENNKPTLTYYGLMFAGAVARSGEND